MKVKELIEILSSLDPEAIALVPAYEFGCDPVENASLIQYIESSRDPKEYWAGKYRELTAWRDEGKATGAGVLITGRHYEP